MHKHSPIVITGCPRSGTQMMGRVFGTLSDKFCLITEHANKQGDIPEDRSGVEDHQLWWDAFDYRSGFDDRGLPVVDMPEPNEDHAASLRERYEQIADGRQIVIKNPSHILYPELVRQVFPDARFVYCARNPWMTLQSMTKAGTTSFLLRSPRVKIGVNSLLHNAAIGWHDAMQAFFTHRDERWVVAQYENLVADPQGSITRLCDELSLSDVNGLEQAKAIPRPSANNNFYYIKQAYLVEPHKAAIMQELEAGCDYFRYPKTPESLDGTFLGNVIHRVTKKAKRELSRLAG